MARIVVTGISGSLGRRVAAQLLGPGRGDDVVGVDLDGGGGLPAGARVVSLDLAGSPGATDDALAAAMVGADAVVHLAWVTADGPGADAMRAAEANRVALARVLAATAASGARRLVHLSSATVYGAWADNRIPLGEDALLRPNPGFGFATGKAEAERVVARWAAAHPEVAVAVLRPTVTLGTPQRPLYEALGGTRVPAVGDGTRPVQYLHVDDLAAAVVLAVDRSLTGVYNVAPDAGMPEATARALSGGVAAFSVPAWVGRPLAALGWDLWRRGIPREARPYAMHPWVVAPDRLKVEGWTPAHTSEEALVATDARPHLDDLPPGRRQQVVLAATGLAVLGGVAGTGAAVLALRRRATRP
ncbi:MAG TPA: NAD-dependent epimerase/dehydratase family protein [Acidimicrobiales bacterium]|nr:NAD-dependent epimerase/dehydratase family protein [Acidimicrobiales bacterium]